MLDPAAKRLNIERNATLDHAAATRIGSTETAGRSFCALMRIEELLIEIRDQNAILLEDRTAPSVEPKRGPGRPPKGV